MNITANMIELHIVRKTKDRHEFLLLRRSKKEIYPGIWQMVSGSIEENETAQAAALRELGEETALTATKMWTVPKINFFYNSRVDAIAFIPVFMVIVGDKNKVIISDEHDAYKWVDSRKAKKMLAWPGQREVIDIIEEYLTKKKNYLKFVALEL